MGETLRSGSASSKSTVANVKILCGKAANLREDGGDTSAGSGLDKSLYFPIILQRYGTMI